MGKMGSEWKLKGKEFTAETRRTQRCFFLLFSGGQPLKYFTSNGYPAFVGPLTGKQKMIKPLRSLRICGAKIDLIGQADAHGHTRTGKIKEGKRGGWEVRRQ